MEARGLLAGLHWLATNRPNGFVRVFGDSALIISLTLSTYRVRASNLAPLIRSIREIFLHTGVTVANAVPRRFNVAADGLCNWVMDLDSDATTTLTAESTQWPITVDRADPTSWGCEFGAFPGFTEYYRDQWAARWSLVLSDYNRVVHIVRHRFLREPPSRSDIQTTVTLRSPPLTRFTTARSEASPFDTDVRRECAINGITRCVPADIFRTFKALALTNGIPFCENTLFIKPNADRLEIPHTDVEFLTAVVSLPNVGIAGALRILRGQTSRDPRPNKALRPKLYRTHLADYPGLQRLCAIAEHGVIPHWRADVERIGVRPLPANYPSAVSGAAIVNHRLLKDYYRGRCLLANIEILAADPGFQASAFALVPKKDIPITEDGRTIHNLAAPIGASVNEDTDTELTPDARWEVYFHIALRVTELRRRYPGCRIFALGADIAEAFLHVPVHERHAPAFGGTLPQSRVGIVSGSAVFGWTASPGFFAIMGKAVRHYQRAGTSYVLGLPEPMWIYQWVDDIVLIEVDIGDRLLRAERRLRDAVKLVFGNDGWHEGKFTTWSERFHAVGIDWYIPEATATLPHRKIDKVKQTVQDTLKQRFVSHKRLESLVGILRHVVTFIPIAKPFMQRIVFAQLASKRAGRSGTPMTTSLRLDLLWWNKLVFQNEFAGVPLTMFGTEPPESDGWVILLDTSTVFVFGLTPKRVHRVHCGSQVTEADLSRILLDLMIRWKVAAASEKSWSLLRLYVRNAREVRLLRTMFSRDSTAQQHLRSLALVQAARKCIITVNRILARSAESRACDVRNPTNISDRADLQTGWQTYQERQLDLNERLSTSLHSARTTRSSNTGGTSAESSDSRCGSTTSLKNGKPVSSVSTQDRVPSKDTIPRDEETSIRHLMARWRQSPSPTVAFETHDSITRLRNLSSLLKAISAPTAKWNGSSQSPHPCCSRCIGSLWGSGQT